MFTYLVIFGLGAVTFVMEKSLTGTKDGNNIFMLVEYLMYTVIDLISTYLLLSPVGRVTIIQSDTGMHEVVYGSSAIIVSLVLSIIWGLVFAFFRKNVKCRIKDDKKQGH